MISPLSCLDAQKNIGVSSCTKFPQQLKGMITTPFGFSLTETEANDPTAWQDAILAEKKNRIYLWPNAVNMEVVSEETIYEETSLSNMLVRDGRYRFRFSFSESLEIHKAMFSHKGFEGKVFLIDNENKLIGTQNSNGDFQGFELDLLNPEKILFNDGSVRSKTPVYVSLYDNKELDVNGAMIDGSFLRQLVRLTDANLNIVGTPTATDIVVDVKNALDNTPVLSLVLADFILLDGTGTAQTISSATADPNIEGRYALAGTGLVSGTLDLAAPADLSIVGFDGVQTTVTI